MADVRIFLASSSELEEERVKFEKLINRENKHWHNKGLFFSLIIWEDFIDCMSRTRLQDEYNKAVAASDIFVMLFHTKVGPFTAEEFDAAYNSFTSAGKPLVYTYHKQNGVINPDPRMHESLTEFIDKLSNVGHYKTNYENTEGMLLHFKQQIDKLIDSGKICPAPGPASHGRIINQIGDKAVYVEKLNGNITIN